MNIKYLVELLNEEKSFLVDLIAKGKTSARKLKRANILLMSNNRMSQDKEISLALNVGTATIYRTKKQFVEEGLEAALNEGARSGMPRCLDGNQEALLIALACSKPPEGLCRWTLSLITEKLIALTELDEVSTETVRRRFNLETSVDCVLKRRKNG